MAGLTEPERRRSLQAAELLFVWNWQRELRPDETGNLAAWFVQLLSAGADHLLLDQLLREAAVASNLGAYAEPMAEHAMAMALALLKRLPQHHGMQGAVCGILGFDGIGKATARRLRALGARIHAVNTSGQTGEPVEFVGTLDDLDAVLRVRFQAAAASARGGQEQGAVGGRGRRPHHPSKGMRFMTVMASSSSTPLEHGPALDVHPQQALPAGVPHTGPSPSRKCSVVAGVAVAMVTVPGHWGRRRF